MHERGPKGDHGQPGDEGVEGRPGKRGRTGETGETGETGRVGETGSPGHVGQMGRPGDEGQPGKTGRRGRSNWQAYLMMGTAMLAALIVFLVQDNKRQDDTARTVLANCEQIEQVKTQIRQTVQASLDRLPTLGYYKTHPDELADALENARDSVRTFKPVDCYRLPAVQEADLKP